ncbi:MAG: DUF4325 domain-containing protein [Candidatus Colwellbacteria bacterium]
MLNKQKILERAAQTGKITTRDLAHEFNVSRQYANGLISELVKIGSLIKIGSTRGAFYVTPEFARENPKILPNRYSKKMKNELLEEHRVLDDIERTSPFFKELPENVKSIFTYAFSEMLNNAIEHSQSKSIVVEVALENGNLSFIVEDFGIGVFRSIIQKRKLKSPLEAIQDLLKGKTTTMPKSHSGEGIFFTSKVGDFFMLDSFGHQLIIDNKIPDIFVKTTKKMKRGTRVAFQISVKSNRRLNNVFKKYTDLTEDGDYGFDKTEIRVRLYTISGVHISRSQARRVLSGLEKFKIILLDFDRVPVVGQAFADEIYRVFQNKHPRILIQETNMNEGVKFMVERARNEAKRQK